jgi:hypothetical protein
VCAIAFNAQRREAKKNTPKGVFRGVQFSLEAHAHTQTDANGVEGNVQGLTC